MLKLSFNGVFFVDNAIRIDGKLCRCDNHISETCQYYALFCGICPNDNYKEKMLNEFGPFRKENAYTNIGKSNMFIGNYLRLFWLCNLGKGDKVLDESVEYFYSMSKKTGTLWEYNSEKVSCNHGFASVIVVIFSRVLFGYNGVNNKTPIFVNSLVNKYTGQEITFNYNGNIIKKKT